MQTLCLFLSSDHLNFLITIPGSLLEKYECLKKEKETLTLKTKMKKRKLV